MQYHPKDRYKDKTPWTPERVEMLTTLWDSELPASAIAVRLGTTKNAVIGKVDRLPLTPRRIVPRH